MGGSIRIAAHIICKISEGCINKIQRSDFNELWYNHSHYFTANFNRQIRGTLGGTNGLVGTEKARVALRELTKEGSIIKTDTTIYVKNWDRLKELASKARCKCRDL